MKAWIHSWLTDREGQPDTGRVLVPIVVLWLLAGPSYELLAHDVHPAYGEVGRAVCEVLAAFGVYLWGDRPRGDK